MTLGEDSSYAYKTDNSDSWVFLSRFVCSPQGYAVNAAYTHDCLGAYGHSSCDIREREGLSLSALLFHRRFGDIKVTPTSWYQMRGITFRLPGCIFPASVRALNAAC